MSEKKQQITPPLLLHKNAEHQDIPVLDRLNKELENERGQIEALKKELDQRFTEIATLTRLLLEKDKTIFELSNDVNKLATDAEVAQLKSAFSSIYKSTSWRVTAPWRYIKKWLGFSSS